MSDQASLLNEQPTVRPLAERIRPADLSSFVGQQHLLGPDAPLRRVLEGGALPDASYTLTTVAIPAASSVSCLLTYSGVTPSVTASFVGHAFP